jgi:hypothetical protein
MPASWKGAVGVLNSRRAMARRFSFCIWRRPPGI